MKKLLRIILRAGIALFFISSLYQQVSAQPTLLAQWKFDGDSTDASGNGHDGTLGGGATYDSDAMQGSQSLILDGTGYVTIDSMDLGEEFSITAWVQLDFDLTDIQTIIANCAGGALVDGFKIYVNDWETANHRIRVEAANETSRKDATTAESVFEEGFWNHIAVTFNTIEGTSTIYYNGEDATDDGVSAMDYKTQGDIWIGAMYDINYPWTGRIDDVRIYDGILTEEDVYTIMNDITAVEEPEAVMPVQYDLGENYPNPFNPTTIIPYTLSKTSKVRLEIFDHLGRSVSVLVNGEQSQGTHEAVFNAQNMASGIYYYQLTTDSHVDTKKMVYIK